MNGFPSNTPQSAIDNWNGYSTSTTSPDPQKMRDLDETRRLLYAALAASRTKRYELVGTLVNALAHHGAGIDPALAMQHVLDLVENDSAWQSEPGAWVREQIEKITELLA